MKEIKIKIENVKLDEVHACTVSYKCVHRQIVELKNVYTICKSCTPCKSAKLYKVLISEVTK